MNNRQIGDHWNVDELRDYFEAVMGGVPQRRA